MGDHTFKGRPWSVASAAAAFRALRWRDLVVVCSILLAVLLAVTGTTRDCDDLKPAEEQLQVLSETNTFGTWVADSPVQNCRRSWAPAFQPFDKLDQHVFAASVLDYLAATAGRNAIRQQKAEHCLEQAGLLPGLFTEARLHEAGKLRVMMLGDSVNRFMLEEVCTLLAGNVYSTRYNEANCQAQLLDIDARFVPGVATEGPWVKPVPGETGPLTDVVREYFRNSSLPYDIVVMASAQWDLNALDMYFKPTLDTVLLPLEVLNDWRNNASAIMQVVEEAAPGAVRMWMTTAPVSGRQEGSPNKSWHELPFINEQLASLNNVGRALAVERKWLVQDLEALTRNLDRRSRLRDGNHPRTYILLELFNRVLVTYLSILGSGNAMAALPNEL